MDLLLSDGIEILNRTPIALRALLKGLPDRWVMSNEGAGTWSPFDIIGHLIQGEEYDWIPRVRIILDLGESLGAFAFSGNCEPYGNWTKAA